MQHVSRLLLVVTRRPVRRPTNSEKTNFTPWSVASKISKSILAASILLGMLTGVAHADHGGGSHIDMNLSGPGFSDTGNYTITWNAGPAVRLQERVGSGAYTTVYTGTSGSKSFVGKSDGTYRYRVWYRICYYGCFDLYTMPVLVTVSLGLAAPAPIQGPSGDADGTFSLSWGSVADASYYELQRRPSGGVWAALLNTGSTTYNETNLGQGLWEYRVRACNAAECSGWASPNKTVGVGPPPGVPGPIMGPDEVPGSSPSYTLSWGAAAGSVTRYDLQESATAPYSWSTVQSSLSLSRYFSGKARNSYFYRVRACNVIGSYSACSAWTQNKLVDVQNFINVNLSAPAESTSGDFTVTWSNPNYYYDTLQQSVDGGAWSNVKYGTGSSYAAVDKPVGDYRYRVFREIEISGGGRDYEPEPISIFRYSSSVTTAVVPPGPNPPENFSTNPAPLEINEPAHGWADQHFSLSWDWVPDAASYELQERLDSTIVQDPNIGVWNTIYQGQSTSVTIYAKKVASSWSYRVRTCTIVLGQCGAWSPIVSINLVDEPTPPPSPPDPPPPPPEEPPTPEEFANQTFFAASGDHNEDGFPDILLQGEYITVLIHSACPLAISCEIKNYYLVPEPTALQISHPSWNFSSYEVIPVDFNRNGQNDLFIRALAPNLPSMQVDFNMLLSVYEGGLIYIGPYTVITRENLGIDLGELGVVVSIEDSNADGYADLVVYRDGIISGIFYGMAPSGKFALPLPTQTGGGGSGGSGDDDASDEADTTTTTALWNGFRDALDAGNVNLAAMHFTSNAREIYRPVMEQLGPNLTSLTANWSQPVLIELTDFFAIYAFQQQEGSAQRLHTVTFVRDPLSGWRIQSF